MQIFLSDAGKRFNRDWIFRKLTYQFTSGKSYAITGPNGSGKSTLLQVIAGAVSMSEGTLTYKLTNKNIEADTIFRHLSIAAPYEEVIEEMTLNEFLDFHSRFKPFLNGFNTESIIAEITLQESANKQIRYFSSGMKQRVKLAQAFFSDTPCILLDEPCTNFDEQGIALYHKLIEKHTKDRLVIVSSNDRQEYGFCEEMLDILKWKPAK